jgi:hypothetical protein
LTARKMGSLIQQTSNPRQPRTEIAAE